METVSITKSRFKHDGQYSLSSYYNLLYDIFRGMGYDVEELNYRNKLRPDGTTEELELFWECTKKMDDYTIIKICPKTLIVGIGKTQAQIDGKPVTRDVGVVELQMSAEIVMDYKNQWAAHPILSEFRKYYDAYFYKPVFDNIKIRAVTEMLKVENEMKAFFNMQTFL